VLRQQLGASRLAVTVPSSTRTLGQSFNLPLDDLQGGAAVYIGNPNGAAAAAVVQFGGSTSPVDSSVSVPGFGVAKVPIAASHAQSNMLVTVTNGVPVVVEAVIGSRLLMLFPVGP
jgi:hypothetical protein